MNETKWHKLGLLFTPRVKAPWMMTHASNPTVEHLNGSIHRVYFGCRDSANCGSLGSFKFRLESPVEVFDVSENPVLGPGSVGCFDDSGVSMGCLVRLEDGTRYLYYVGWNLAVTVPWRNSIGIAIAKPGQEIFEKYSLAPILDRNQVDPYSLSYPWVVKLSCDNWLMYYGSNLSWGKSDKAMNHVIKIAHSSNGIEWRREGAVAIGLKRDEIGISRPCVSIDDGLYKMWYSYRSETYRIGYAESRDGCEWQRKDVDAGIDVSDDGFDSNSISYGCVFDYDSRRYMLYNGNEYGRTGIGLAVLRTSG
jgi:predicted GH43/DUF377 family glycosyl hydrolase